MKAVNEEALAATSLPEKPFEYTITIFTLQGLLFVIFGLTKVRPHL